MQPLWEQEPRAWLPAQLVVLPPLVLPREQEPSLSQARQPWPELAPEPQPSPRRKADIAENLFADVMALTEEERIALFT